ncbi:hypothetical protein PHET_00877 [Paragonimus heterotremus]|uniref:Uncharacterized protein n=1 Tax=Paragonimus heterotremus TaxID=100268 RepID=A0A8J4TIN5_9TREM|nr:hypothetical protein PHET_00877 [Paragonimus heterotremus]
MTCPSTPLAHKLGALKRPRFSHFPSRAVKHEDMPNRRQNYSDCAVDAFKLNAAEHVNYPTTFVTDNSRYVQAIPDVHTAGVPALVKIAVPEILDGELSKVRKTVTQFIEL